MGQPSGIIGRLSLRSGLVVHWTEASTVTPTRGPFLERLGNLTGPNSYFEIKVSRKVWCVLTSNEVHFVSLADNFTAPFSKLFKLPSLMVNKQLNGPGNFRELREMGPGAHFSKDPVT